MTAEGLKELLTIFADADTGLTHIGAREYDPATGRFLSVDPVLAPDDHESLNGYAYANNTPVTKSDPTGLRPITDCERGCSDGKGGTYRDYMTMGPNGTWVYHSTKTYTQTFQYQKTGGGTGSGSMTVTVRTDGGHTSAKVVFKYYSRRSCDGVRGNVASLRGDRLGCGACGS